MVRIFFLIAAAVGAGSPNSIEHQTKTVSAESLVTPFALPKGLRLQLRKTYRGTQDQSFEETFHKNYQVKGVQLGMEPILGPKNPKEKNFVLKDTLNEIGIQSVATVSTRLASIFTLVPGIISATFLELTDSTGNLVQRLFSTADEIFGRFEGVGSFDSRVQVPYRYTRWYGSPDQRFHFHLSKYFRESVKVDPTTIQKAFSHISGIEVSQETAGLIATLLDDDRDSTDFLIPSSQDLATQPANGMTVLNYLTTKTIIGLHGNPEYLENPLALNHAKKWRPVIAVRLRDGQGRFVDIFSNPPFEFSQTTDITFIKGHASGFKGDINSLRTALELVAAELNSKQISGVWERLSAEGLGPKFTIRIMRPDSSLEIIEYHDRNLGTFKPIWDQQNRVWISYFNDHPVGGRNWAELEGVTKNTVRIVCQGITPDFSAPIIVTIRRSPGAWMEVSEETFSKILQGLIRQQLPPMTLERIARKLAVTSQGSEFKFRLTNDVDFRIHQAVEQLFVQAKKQKKKNPI